MRSFRSLPSRRSSRSSGLMRPPLLDDIDRIARAELAALEDPFGAHLGDVVVRVEEFCDASTEMEMELESPFELLGLYRGVSLDRKSIADGTAEIDMIFLYRRPILDYWCETGEDLVDVVRHVLIHEIGHHFGLGDADMHRIEQGG